MKIFECFKKKQNKVKLTTSSEPPTQKETNKPRIGIDAQAAVLWLHRNGGDYFREDNWAEWVTFIVKGQKYNVLKLSEKASEYYSGKSSPIHGIPLNLTGDEAEWVFWNMRQQINSQEKSRMSDFREIVKELT